jgi:hypothetical protein
LHHGRGVGGQLVFPYWNCTAKPSAISVARSHASLRTSELRQRDSQRSIRNLDNPEMGMGHIDNEKDRTRDRHGTDGNCDHNRPVSYGRKLVTARRGEAAYRGGVQRLHFSTEGVIRRDRH